MEHKRMPKPGYLLLSLLLVTGFASASSSGLTIAFGSCFHPWRPSPVLETIRRAKPDLFVFTGDNTYADRTPKAASPLELWTAYRHLAESTEFVRLQETVPVRVAWDDHDYGQNDGGAGYSWKALSKELLVDFFGFPPGHPVRSRPGLYYAETIYSDDRRVQLVVLDTRSFRTDLRPADGGDPCPRGGYLPDDSPAAALLGEQQWQWLHGVLQVPADIRIIVSSIQVLPEDHCREKGANLPAERARLPGEIDGADDAPVILVGGDRHHGEISRLVLPGGKTVHERLPRAV